MAQLADVQEQLERMEARLRLVPGDEMPPAEEVRKQVRRWQEHLHEAADTIRWADDSIERINTTAEFHPSGAGSVATEHSGLLKLVRSVRARAFALMQRLNPDQAWFWTEEWQAGERAVDRDLAAGRVTHFASDDKFDAALDALDAEADVI